MAHDGQDQFLTQNALLTDLLDQTGRSAEVVNVVLERAIEAVRSKVSQDGRISATLIELNQTAAHGLAWLATYVESLKQMQKWAETLQTEGGFGETEQLILQISFGEYLSQILGGIPMSQNEIVRLSDLGLTSEDTAVLADDAVMALVSNGNVQGVRLRLVELMQENNADVIVGASGLDEELEMIREQFRRYSLDRIEPVAHEWHLNDELIPMEIIEELAELGVFGLTIPEEYDG
ncbi:MAG: acyl-CoA dehydrogenase family protein, partial [Paracoccaceae bacterium]